MVRRFSVCLILFMKWSVLVMRLSVSFRGWRVSRRSWGFGWIGMSRSWMSCMLSRG